MWVWLILDVGSAADVGVANIRCRQMWVWLILDVGSAADVGVANFRSRQHCSCGCD